jgi:putative SOS response-associated peptidase YedK
MCGRYTLTYSLEDLLALFGAPDRPNFAPTWNAAPTDAMPVVRRGGDGGPRLSLVRWGLVPHWSRTGPTGSKPLINARSETAHEKPTFRQALARRRALIPADSFYEWTKEGDARQPWLIRRTDGHPMVFAGLWERWGEGADRIDSFAILTAEAGDDIRHLHHRTPVMVTPDRFPAWLDPANDPAPFLAAPPEGALEAFRVSAAVNSIRRNGPELIEPLAS